jgi:DNA-directed RNA polymerase subunit beta'
VARRRDAMILQQKQAGSAADPIEGLPPAAE